VRAVDAQHEVGVADRVAVVRPGIHALRRCERGVEAADVRAGGDEVAGDRPARLAEPEHRDAYRHQAGGTTGVPWVWKVSMVFSPHAWPLARSSRFQLIVFQSGARMRRAPALHISMRLPPGSHT